MLFNLREWKNSLRNISYTNIDDNLFNNKQSIYFIIRFNKMYLHN